MPRIGLIVAVTLLICLRPPQWLPSACANPMIQLSADPAPENIPVESTGETASIEELVLIGLSRNPQILEAQSQIEALRYRIPQVQSLPDPNINTTTFLSPVQTAAGEQAFALGISQKFTNRQRRATQACVVASEVAAAEARLANVQLEIAENIRVACYQLLFLRESIAITEEDLATLNQITRVIEQQYEVKRAVTLQDVLNAQVERSTIENQLIDLKQKVKSYQARLARLMRLDPSTEIRIADQLKTSMANLDAEALIAQATAMRPDLQIQLAQITRDQRRIQLAALENRPDFTVGLNWIATSNNGISPVANGDDSLLLNIGFNLPIRKNRIAAGISEAQANRNSSESRLDSLRDQAAEEVFDLVVQLQSNEDTLSLLKEDIIPKAEQTLALSIQEYSADKIQYIQLIANWRSLLRYRISEANLQSQHAQLLASLAKSVGQLEPIGTKRQPSAAVLEIGDQD